MGIIQNFDMSVINFIKEYIQSDFMDELMSFITFLGDKGLIWFLTAFILLLIPRTRRAGTMMLFSVGVSFLFSEGILKQIVQRPRPFIEHSELMLIIPAPSGFSFPSSHSCTSFAASTALFINNKPLGTVGLIIAVLIAFSRIYLTVHYCTDVVSGSILGIISAVITALIFKAIDRKKEIK